jgi:hypothetical protein
MSNLSDASQRSEGSFVACHRDEDGEAIWLFVVRPDDGHNFDLDVHLRNSQRFQT